MDWNPRGYARRGGSTWGDVNRFKILRSTAIRSTDRFTRRSTMSGAVLPILLIAAAVGGWLVPSGHKKSLSG